MLVAGVLNIPAASATVCEVGGGHRHRCFEIRARDRRWFLKLDEDREGATLACLSGEAMVPQIVATGLDDRGRTWLLTEALPGATARPATLDLRGVAWWLSTFGRHPSPRLGRLLTRRAEQFAGVWAANYDPRPHAYAASVDVRTPFTAAWCRGWKGRSEVVHGSLAVHNLLIGVGGELTGVVDFEATRIGDGRWDIATLTLDLALADIDTALRWLSAADSGGSGDLPGVGLFVLAQHHLRVLATRRRGSAGPTWDTPQPEVLRRRHLLVLLDHIADIGRAC
ncbi:MAG: aminoglycoside phosphotransferase family protein [Actinobacteria bacterium]|nr:aminoglycoside phosphotransferase family protein [Actinomycetota bacterium]